MLGIIIKDEEEVPKCVCGNERRQFENIYGLWYSMCMICGTRSEPNISKYEDDKRWKTIIERRLN